jgi:hypothetical protein
MLGIADSEGSITLHKWQETTVSVTCFLHLEIFEYGSTSAIYIPLMPFGVLPQTRFVCHWTGQTGKPRESRSNWSQRTCA